MKGYATARKMHEHIRYFAGQGKGTLKVGVKRGKWDGTKHKPFIFQFCPGPWQHLPSADGPFLCCLKSAASPSSTTPAGCRGAEQPQSQLYYLPEGSSHDAVVSLTS